MKVRVFVALIAAACVLFGVGTASAESAAKSPAPPDGFVTTTVKPAGLSIALPVTWLALDPKSKQATSELEQVAKKNPNLQSLVAQWSSIKSSVKLWAIDGAATGFASNVLVLPLPIDKSVLQKPASVEAVLKSQFGSRVSDLHVHKVKLGRVGAVEADATASINSVDGTPFTAYVTIYLLPSKQGVIDVDYTSSTPRSNDATLHTMIDNLRVL